MICRSPDTALGKLTIRNVEIIGFTAKGGNGANGGGGGLGAGGAIYAAGAELTIDSSTFVNNGAGGGNGSDDNIGPAGGGGGLGGHGGRGTPKLKSREAGPAAAAGGREGTGGPNGSIQDFNGAEAVADYLQRRRGWRRHVAGRTDSPGSRIQMRRRGSRIGRSRTERYLSGRRQAAVVS